MNVPSPSKTLPKDVVFYYPSQVVGGAEFLMLRSAQVLAEALPDVAIWYCEYPGGFAQSRDLSSVGLIEVIDGEPTTLPPGALIITPGIYLTTLPQRIANVSDHPVWFWLMHPLNLLYQFVHMNLWLATTSQWLRTLVRQCFYRRQLDYLRALTAHAEALGSLFYVDLDVWQFQTKLLGIPLEKRYLPIMVPPPPPQDPATRKQPNPEAVCIGWLGRLNEDKVPALNNLLGNVDALAKQQPHRTWRVLVVGDGPMRKDLYQPTQPTVTVEVLGTLPREAYTRLFWEHVDLAAAMGTSALECGGLGLPTLLVDFSLHRPYFVTQFRWLFETQEFLIGTDAHAPLVPRNHPFKDIIDQVVSANNREALAAQCQAYVEHHHYTQSLLPMMMAHLHTRHFRYTANVMEMLERFQAAQASTDGWLRRLRLYRPLLKRYLKITGQLG